MDVNELIDKADGLMEPESITARAAYAPIAQAYALTAIAKLLNTEAGPCGYGTPFAAVGPDLRARCTLTSGHLGLHTDGIATWDNGAPVPDRPEPTKPAVDRLHELQSYAATKSEEHFRTLNDYPQTAESVAKLAAASKAYDDMAEKLQEILSEGNL